MQNELTLSVSTLLGFLLVLTRISSAFVFVPLPGSQSGPALARIVLSLGCTVALSPRWPTLEGVEPTIGLLVQWMLSEAALGLAVGIAVSFLAEAFVMGAQIVSLQAGYGYASTIDPTTQSDAGILLVLAQLLAGMLFFAFGLDRQVIHAFAASLDAYPPGSFALSRSMVEGVVRLGSSIFSIGLRLAFPVLGLLLMVDIALAVLGRLAAQLQLISIAFPVKMLVSFLLLAWIVVLFPNVYQGFAGESMRAVFAITRR